MATPYPGAVQVGSYFVGQYYKILQQQPEHVYQFYSDASTMLRINGDSTESASAMLEIHTMVTLLNYTAIEIKTINSLESWNGGVLVTVSGSVKTKESVSRRKFVQTFFLAPQDKGYFVLNDIFQFIEDGSVSHHQAPFLSENMFDTRLHTSTTRQEPKDYILENEASEYVNSVNIEDNSIDKYSLPPDHRESEQQEDFEPEIVVEETAAEEAFVYQDMVNNVQDYPVVSVEEPVGEPTKKTYASILQVAKESYAPTATTQQSYVPTVITQQSYAPAVAAQPSYNQNSSEWDYSPQPTQQYEPPSSYMPDSGYQMPDDGSSFDEEYKSVYVRNLPFTITPAEIEDEFKNFGVIKPDGVFIRNRKDVVGVCYAFVEFEDITSVENAIKASPIYMAGRQVYIEERRPNPTGVRAGRGRGRGRGSYPTEAPRGRFGSRNVGGRGGSQDGSADYRPRGNGNGYPQQRR